MTRFLAFFLLIVACLTWSDVSMALQPLEKRPPEIKHIPGAEPACSNGEYSPKTLECLGRELSSD